MLQIREGNALGEGQVWEESVAIQLGCEIHSVWIHKPNQEERVTEQELQPQLERVMSGNDDAF